MSISFSGPEPTVFHNIWAFYVGWILGFVIVILTTVLLDKLGTYLFHRGYAKPFYVKGHRMHHIWIYLLIPGFYVFFSILILLGYAQVIWSDVYLRIISIFAVAGVCMAIDFIGDKLWPKIRRDVILHHEWIYTFICIYIIQFVINVRI